MPKSVLTAVFLFMFMCQWALYALGQNKNNLIVGGIQLHGNEKTKDFIILRELGFKTGDSLSQERLIELRNLAMWQIYSLSLFTSVDIDIQEPDENRTVNIDIYLKERWFFFAVPILEIAERNFNSWWTSGENRIHRINYGTRISVFNLRGRNETMRINLQSGFTRKFSVDYTVPYINKKLTLGAQLNFTYSDNREIGYGTLLNKLTFFRDPNQILHQRIKTGLGFKYRPKIYTTHLFDVGYNSLQIADTVSKLNPDYFLNGATRQQYFFIGYNFYYDQRNSIKYPLRGVFFEAYSGNYTFVTQQAPVLIAGTNAAYYKWIGSRHYANVHLSAKFSNPTKQPYHLFKALGYGYFVRGFEYNVIDGQHLGLIKTNYIFNILKQRQYYINNKDKLRKFSTIPLALYAKLYCDAAYVHNGVKEPGNTLNNTLLAGYGAGIDIITYYDRAFAIEYSFNNKGQSGLFLHYSISF